MGAAFRSRVEQLLHIPYFALVSSYLFLALILI